MSTVVSLNSEKSRYEIRVDDTFAGFTVAEPRGEVLVMPHTVVFDEFEGKGLASQLVAGALDDIRTRGSKVVVVCPYITRFLGKHPEYADLVA